MFLENKKILNCIQNDTVQFNLIQTIANLSEFDVLSSAEWYAEPVEVLDTERAKVCEA